MPLAFIGDQYDLGLLLAQTAAQPPGEMFICGRNSCKNKENFKICEGITFAAVDKEKSNIGLFDSDLVDE
jgi:hypothetical protein